MSSAEKKPDSISAKLTLTGCNLTLLLGTLFTLFFVGEVGVRLFMADSITLFPRYHTNVTYNDFTIRRLRPDTTFWHTSIDGEWKFVTNAQGFRDHRNFTYEKKQGVIRVVTLGDSMTQGFEVNQEQTYSAVIERHLAEHGIQTEVINMGVSGFSTAEELVLLENEAIKYNPDYVVLGFYANDFEDNIKAGLFLLENGELVTKKKTHVPGVNVLNIVNEVNILRWLSENSYLYSFTLNTAWSVSKRLLLSHAKEKLQTEFAVSTENVDSYKFQLANRLVQEMHDFCRQRGVPFIILDIPKPMPSSSQVTSSIPLEYLAAISANSDGFVNGQKLLKGYQNITEFHVPHGQRHISAFTHEILGKKVARVILDMHRESTEDRIYP